MYIFSGVLQVFVNIIHKNLLKFSKIFKILVYLIYFSRKVHLVLLNLILVHLVFNGTRIWLHVDYRKLGSNEFMKYLLLNIALFFLMVDIFKIISTSFYLADKASYKDKDEKKK